MTELFILGLLNQEVLSGYDIQKALQSSQVEMWGGILVGSIYHALHKLEKNKCISIVETKNIGRRKTNIYKTTNIGNERLISLIIKHMENEENTYPNGIFAALTFSHLVPFDISITALSKQIIKIENKIRLINEGLVEKEKVYVNDIARETICYMKRNEELHLQYLKNVIDILKREERSDDN